jgi:hypothetical protein
VEADNYPSLPVNTVIKTNRNGIDKLIGGIVNVVKACWGRRW